MCIFGPWAPGRPVRPGGGRGAKNAHFFGYLITLPVGTDFAPRDFWDRNSGGRGLAPAGRRDARDPGPGGGARRPDPEGPARVLGTGLLTTLCADGDERREPTQFSSISSGLTPFVDHDPTGHE